MMQGSRNALIKILEGLLQNYKPDLTQAVNQLPGGSVAPATGTDRGSVSLSDAAPADVGDAGTADSGTAGDVSRSDHVHDLPLSGVTPDTYGDATHIPQITIDPEGRITAAVEIPAAGGAGTVTSVALTAAPTGIFDVSGSPITGSGTLALSMDNQNANLVLAGPGSGAAATPAFRALVALDIPNLDMAKITTGILGSTQGGTGVNNAGRTLTLSAGNIDLAAHGGDRAILFPADGYAVIQASPAAIQSTLIPYGDGNNSLKAEAAFSYDQTNNELQVDRLRLIEQGGTPGTPSSGYGVFYVTSSGRPQMKDDSGLVHQLSHQGARVYNNAAISINNNTVTALTFNTERYDTGGFHSTSSNTGRLTISIAGRYMLTGSVEFAANATGRRYYYMRVNGATLIAIHGTIPPATGSAPAVIGGVMWEFAATDYIELLVYQDSGGALNVTASAAYGCEFMIEGPF